MVLDLDLLFVVVLLFVGYLGFGLGCLCVGLCFVVSVLFLVCLLASCIDCCMWI